MISFGVLSIGFQVGLVTETNRSQRPLQYRVQRCLHLPSKQPMREHIDEIVGRGFWSSKMMWLLVSGLLCVGSMKDVRWIAKAGLFPWLWGSCPRGQFQGHNTRPPHLPTAISQ